jgi:hypothetical protein
MLINSLQELRLFFPSHALQSIDPLTGFIDNSEHDFLQDKLGTPLYNDLCKYYATASPSLVEDGNTSYRNRLLLMAQRVVAFDAFSRAIGVHAVSISNAGVNISVADDYVKPDKEAIDAYKQTCIKEAHSAVNRLLATLEEWTQYAAASEEPDEELTAIVSLWRQSRFFYLAAELLIPSAKVLQEYLNIYDSREKFIQLLPDLRYIQEEMLTPAIGEELTDYLVSQSQQLPATVSEASPEDKLIIRTIHSVRKFMAAALEERSEILRTSNNRRAKAHDEQVRLLQSLKEHIARHQDDFLSLSEDAMKGSPLYIDPEDTRDPYPLFENNQCGNAIFVTPPLR